MKKILSSALILLLVITAVSAQELAMVRDNDLFGYINKSGGYAIQTQFEKADSFSGKMAPAMKDKKWGFINKVGKEIVLIKYDEVSDFFEGVSRLKIMISGVVSLISAKNAGLYRVFRHLKP